jgi:Domain of Unknown Function (DUF1080)
MRTMIALCLLATGAWIAGEGDGEKGRSNELTPKEAAEGWLLLFDGESTFGWSASEGGKMTVAAGALRMEGAGSFQTNAAFDQYALTFQCRVHGANTHDDVRLSFAGRAAGIAIPKEKAARWNQAKLLVAGGRYQLTVTSDRGTFPSLSGELAATGPTPLSFTVAEGVAWEVRDMTLVPLAMKSLFNGKNLEGWREFPGKKSKFAVNDKLELLLRDGPGDLQTEAKFADFLLQIECFSNGDRLNSGVFFRCRPNEYQNGYEAQIHNGFTATAAKEYTIDEYDPKTHALVGQKKAMYTAIDFGTGAIYRRIPARKEVAKDREWFTLSVLANGNHICSWVNGIQVVDWFDNRPPHSNPRNGCRLEAGHISIQGHDPTTDLSFRNIRIRDYQGMEKPAKAKS